VPLPEVVAVLTLTLWVRSSRGHLTTLSGRIATTFSTLKSRLTVIMQN
jgi:hypothetical protein